MLITKFLNNEINKKIKNIMMNVFKRLMLCVGLLVNSLVIFSQEVNVPDTVQKTATEVLDLEMLLRLHAVEVPDTAKSEPKKQPVLPAANPMDTSELLPELSDTAVVITDKVFVIDRDYILNIDRILQSIEFYPIDDIYLRTNPLYIDMVLNIEQLKKINIEAGIQPYSINFGKKHNGFNSVYSPLRLQNETFLILGELREYAARKVLREAPQLFKFHSGQMVDLSKIRNVNTDRPISRVQIIDENAMVRPASRIAVADIKKTYWTRRAVSELQFSQHYVSDNWHKGGNDYIAILGTLSGQLNYDNKKNIQWENRGEWRAGFNSIEGDTIRALSTNDDVFRLNSKLGVKAGGNFFWSASFDFNTNLFRNYSGVNSTRMRANFLTPVRMNVGVGMDYKYKKMFSVMLSPLSYRFVYANDTVNIAGKSFGLEPGKNQLHDLGSSLRVQFSHQFSPEVQIESKLFFYTNYTKVEFDWEIVGNFRVNRFLSTRILLNPRYDNTMILKGADKPQWQFKEMITFGLSYRLLN